MIIEAPLIITARLMAGVRIGDAFISIGEAGETSEGRTKYEVWIDLPDGSEYGVTDLRSGCQGGDIYEGMESLLSFLGAAADSYGYRQRTGRKGENEDLFPPAVVEWAHENQDDIYLLQCELVDRHEPRE